MLGSFFGIHAIDLYWHICHIFARGKMSNIYQKLGDSIRKYRRKENISQEELAAKAQLDLTSVSEIESGLRNPSLKTIHKLAKALRVDVRDLITF